MNAAHLVRGINATDANTATGMIIVIHQVLFQFNTAIKSVLALNPNACDLLMEKGIDS